MPITSSTSARNGPNRSDQFAIGAVATPRRPTRSVWPSSQSRNRGRWPALSCARARLFISAIFTSAGQAVVHIPQPEHQSTVASGDWNEHGAGRLRREERRQAEALRLRPDVLRAREPIRDAGDRTHRVADVALEAVVGREPDFERRRLGDDVHDRHERTSAGVARRRRPAFGPTRPVAHAPEPASVAAARTALAIATPSPHRWLK